MATRQQKYPDTDTFHYYNANPYIKNTCDCTYRAISTVLSIDYFTVVEEMTEQFLNTGIMPNDTRGEALYLESKGWKKHKQPRKPDGSKYTGKEFCKLMKDTWCVCHIGGHHTTCIIYGQVNDIWDCTDKYVGNYWTKG